MSKTKLRKFIKMVFATYDDEINVCLRLFRLKTHYTTIPKASLFFSNTFNKSEASYCFKALLSDMEKKLEDALQVFATLLNQIENNADQIRDPLGQINCAQRRVINLIIDSYFQEPALLNKEFEDLISKPVYEIAVYCYHLLDDYGAELPEERDCEAYLAEPLNVYLVYFLHDKLLEILDYFEELKETEIPVWYQ